MRDRRSFSDGTCWVELVIAGRKSEQLQRPDEVQMLTQRERGRQKGRGKDESEEENEKVQ